MCEAGVNREQLRRSIGRAEEALGMAQHWLEDLHMIADQGELHRASMEMAQVTVLLGEARGKLEKAVSSLEASDHGESTVEIV